MTAGRYRTRARASDQRDGGEDSPRERRMRADANRQLDKALGAIKVVRILYIVLAALAGFVLVLFLVAMAQVSSAAASAAPIFMILVLVQGGTVVLYVIGAIRISKEPGVWSLLLAILQTLAAILGPGIIPIALAVCCWIAFAAISPARNLARRYPELAKARQLQRGIYPRSGGRRQAGEPRRGQRYRRR